MKIDLDLPDWVEGKHLYVMAGVELVAYKYLDQPWQMKTGRCNMCGKCCENLGEVSDMSKVVNGTCINLKQDGDKKVCGLGIDRPFSCCAYICTNLSQVKEGECAETFKEVNGIS